MEVQGTIFIPFSNNGPSIDEYLDSACAEVYGAHIFFQPAMNTPVN